MNQNYFAVVSSDLPASIRRRLNECFKLILLPPDRLIDIPVQTHPDMIMTLLDGNIFVPSSYFSENREVVEQIALLGGLKIIESSVYRDKKYPNDVSLNTSIVGRFLLCRKKSVSRELLKFAEVREMTVIDTNQGYAGCSCIVANESVLTSDKCINLLLLKNGIDSVYVSNDDIILDGYGCGFIGGCGGFCEGKIYLFGKYNRELQIFADSRGFEILSLSDSPLTDFGGIKFIRYKK